VADFLHPDAKKAAAPSQDEDRGRGRGVEGIFYKMKRRRFLVRDYFQGRQRPRIPGGGAAGHDPEFFTGCCWPGRCRECAGVTDFRTEGRRRKGAPEHQARRTMGHSDLLARKADIAFLLLVFFVVTSAIGENRRRTSAALRPDLR
jgi:hypothetical protein